MNRQIPRSSGHAHLLDVPGLARELHVQMQRYIEAQYPIRHAELVAERQALLQTTGVLSREPFIECMPGYVSGPAYRDLPLPALFTSALAEMAAWPSAPIPARLYQHQARALEAFFQEERDLIIVTGTGSGKTETFLLPIVLRSIAEAKERSHSFGQPGMRTLLLYPMNALVNDQHMRLRKLFGHPQWVSWFAQRLGASRPIRFSMYTSRTPYPGVMSKKGNEQQLIPLLDYYLDLESEQGEREKAFKHHGRWPALDLAALREAAYEGKTHIGERDYELYTRHQVQACCPDVLITNYSMLEYMLMRPIEQSLFQQTAEWLNQDSANTLLIALDESHLYSGVTGAEIALLLRRLQARLGIDRRRVRYILTSASLDAGDRGEGGILDFAATLVGEQDRGRGGFAIIQGQRVGPLALSSETGGKSEREASVLADFDLPSFAGRAADPEAGRAAIVELARQFNWPAVPDSQELAHYLGRQIPGLPAFRHLWEKTAGQAESFFALSRVLFPSVGEQAADRATSALLSLSSAASLEDGRPLLPVRAHLFFRGLPALYACINPRCSARRAHDGLPGVLGALGLSPRLHCECGARVFELYAHRNCGAVFLRAFAPAEPSDFYWHEPGGRKGHGHDHSGETLLLVGSPHPRVSVDACEPVDLHIMTGRVVPVGPRGERQGEGGDTLRVSRPVVAKARGDKADSNGEESGLHWKSCPVCRKRLHENALTNFATKGEQPFVNLVRRQFELQPPGGPFQATTPNMGRKLLLFSDGRQRAARLARDLPREVELDTFRQALLLAVARMQRSLVSVNNELYREFVAVCAEHHLYFFDGDSQRTLLRQMQDLRESYESIEEARDDGWDPDIVQGYRVALLRQVADRFYSVQRMCAAVVEPTPGSLRQLKRRPVFAHLEEQDLRALAINWIEDLLDESAFDARIAPEDRENTVPGSGFAYATEKWNDTEEAARDLLGYTQNDLHLIRQAFVDELCEKSGEYAFLRPEKGALRLTLKDSWHQCADCTRLHWLPLRGRCSNPRCGSVRLVELPGDDLSLRARTDFYREPLRQFIAGERVPVHLTAEEHTAQLSHRDVQQVSTTTEEYELRFQDIGLSGEKPAIDILSCTTTMEVGIDIGSLLGIGLRTMPPRRANYQQRAGRAGRRTAALATVLTYSENGSHDGHYFENPAEMIAGSLPSPQVSPINERLTRRHLQAALIQTFFHEQVGKAGKLSERQYSSLSEALGTATTFFLTTGPYSLAAFAQWLEEALRPGAAPLLPHVIAWLPDSAIAEKRPLDFVRSVAQDFVVRLRGVAQQLFPSDALVNATQEASPETGVEEVRLLDLLFEHGFLPTYAFPREVRDFVIEKRKPGSSRIGVEQRPERSVDIALSEYAPGRELIVNKATYRVGGIYVDPFPGVTPFNRVSFLFQQARTLFVLCLSCGYARRQGDEQRSEAKQCPLCQASLTTQEILDPPGFAPERGKALEQRQIHNDGTAQSGSGMQIRLVLPQDSVDGFRHATADGRIAWSDAEHRELLIVNSGRTNDGFAICRTCGAAAPGNPAWLQKAHERPFHLLNQATAPQKCNTPDGIWRGFLGHLFHSDLLLLRFQWPEGVAYESGQTWMHDAFVTLTQALVLAATRLLDISTSELQAGWSYTIAASRTPSDPKDSRPVVYFFLFDTLSGGAGYATQVGAHVDRLLLEAQRILDDCPDECEQSCYRCLRAYQNRMYHHRLDRHLAGTLLRAIVSGQPPETTSVAQQVVQLEMLQRYLELAGRLCQREVKWRGVMVPLLVKTTSGDVAVGTYPVQQDRQIVKHPLDALPASQGMVLSTYALVHDLPHIAELLLLR